jgi:hypothetical protein
VEILFKGFLDMTIFGWSLLDFQSWRSFFVILSFLSVFYLFIQVLPNKGKASDLYSFMEKRLAPYLKTTVREFIANHESKLKKSSSYLSILPSDNSNVSCSLFDLSFSFSFLEQQQQQQQQSSSAVNSKLNRKQPGGSSVNNRWKLGLAAADTLKEITRVPTDDVVAGYIPSKGFSLRLITGLEFFQCVLDLIFL